MYGFRPNQTNSVMNINMSNQYMFQVGSLAAQTQPMNNKLPVGVFWDLENCGIPRGLNVCILVNKIRAIFGLYNFLEREFSVVGDVYGTNNNVINDLNAMQLNFVHVCSYAKNAGDEKLKQMIHRFLMVWGQQSAIILLTSDINFAPLLSDIVHRIGCFVILFHRTQVSPALTSCAHLTMNFDEFCRTIPLSTSISDENNTATYLKISNWPLYFNETDVRAFLNLISDNCGGRVLEIDFNLREANLLFKCKSDADRCSLKVNNRRYLGNTLKASINYSRANKPKQNISQQLLPPQPLLLRPLQTLTNQIADRAVPGKKTDKQVAPSPSQVAKVANAAPFLTKKSSSKTFTFEKSKVKSLVIKKEKVNLNVRQQKDKQLKGLTQVFHLLDLMNNYHDQNCDCLISFSIENIYAQYCLHFSPLKGNSQHQRKCSLAKVFEQSLTRLNQSQTSSSSLFLIYMPSDVYLQKCDFHWIDRQVMVFFKVLFECSVYSLTWKQLMTQFKDELGYKFGPSCLLHHRFRDVVRLGKDDTNNCVVKLSPLYEFAAQLMSVMLYHSNFMVFKKWDMDQLAAEYYDHFGISMNDPSCFAATSYKSLIEQIDLLFVTNKSDGCEQSKTSISFKCPEFIANINVKRIPTCNYCEKTNQPKEGVTLSDIFDQELFEIESAPTVNMLAC